MNFRQIIIIAICCLFITNGYAQILNIGDTQTANLILRSNKNYKLIYIFCNYCQASKNRFSKVAEFGLNNNIESYFICAQDSFEVADYIDTCKIKPTMYMINQNRKRKLISFYNPIKATCKFLKKHFNINVSKMGASDFFILDKNNKIIKQSNWEMKDEEYFLLLEE